jgi:hypothetical protein
VILIYFITILNMSNQLFRLTQDEDSQIDNENQMFNFDTKRSMNNQQTNQEFNE